MSDILVAPGSRFFESTLDVQSAAPSQGFRYRLKLCFIAETVHAGVGRHLTDAITALAGHGHEVHLIHSQSRIDPQFIQIIQHQPNVRTLAVAMPRAIGPEDVRALRHILTYMRANGPFDIIHGHSSKGGGYARLLKLFGFGPILYSPHAFITMSPLLSRAKRVLYRALEWILGHLTDGIICTSQAEQLHAAQYLGLAEARLSRIINGNAPASAPSRELVRERLDLKPSDIAVGFAGRMEDQKAPERIIAAARRVMPDLPNLVLVMIGAGPKRDALVESIKGSGFEDRVRWPGAVDARQYLPGFDVFVLPSLYEGFPYVLLEALSAGLPIVSTPVGGTQEAIEDGVNGFLVPHGVTEAMAAAIRRLTTDDALRHAMAAASRNRAEQFTIPRMVQAMEGRYLQLLKENEPRRHGAVAAQALRPR